MGKWDDEWVEHPFPALNEPQKAMAWLTRRDVAEDGVGPCQIGEHLVGQAA